MPAQQQQTPQQQTPAPKQLISPFNQTAQQAMTPATPAFGLAKLPGELNQEQPNGGQ